MGNSVAVYSANGEKRYPNFLSLEKLGIGYANHSCWDQRREDFPNGAMSLERLGLHSSLKRVKYQVLSPKPGGEMRRILAITLFIPMVIILGQSASDSLPPYAYNITHSAPVSGGTTYIRTEVDTANTGYTPTIGEVIYTTNNWTSTTTRTATNVGDPDAEVFEANISNPGSGEVEYYVHFEDDELWGGTSPIYDGGATTGIPANFYVGINDGAGTDSTLPSHSEANDLDILQYWFTISNDRFYGKIQNATGSWFTIAGGGFSRMHIYAYLLAITNPNRANQDLIYVMGYTGELAAGGIEPGVSKVNVAEGSIENIGAFAYNISGDILEMSAPISTFTGDADFGGTTPAWGFYQVSAATFYISIPAFSVTPDVTRFIDATKVGKYFINNFSDPQPWAYTVGSNTPPTLSLAGTDGNLALITFTDSDNNFPTVAEVLINGVHGPYDMHTDDFRYNDGSRFSVDPGFYIGSGTELYFTFSDGMATVNETYTMMDTDEGIALMPKELEIVSNTPNPFNPATEISYTLAEDGYARLEIFDQSGRLVDIIVEGMETSGLHKVTWNASHKSLESGIYLARLISNGEVRTRKMLLIK